MAKTSFLRSTANRSQRGQSLVELAISIIVMLLLVAGAVDFGMAFFSYVALRDAAQEGALFGSFDPYVDDDLSGFYTNGEPLNEDEIRDRVRAASRAPVDFADTTRVPDGYISVELDPSDADGGRACEGNVIISGVTTPHAIRVTVEYDYPIITPLVGSVLGGQTIHLTATVTDTILEPRCPPP